LVADAWPFLRAGESDCSISPSWSHDDHASGESTSEACGSMEIESDSPHPGLHLAGMME